MVGQFRIRLTGRCRRAGLVPGSPCNAGTDEIAGVAKACLEFRGLILVDSGCINEYQSILRKYFLPL
jgi:hypothetical protein